MYALHYLLPFGVAALLAAHLMLLHILGSGTASTVPGTTVDGDAFLVYYYKDALRMCRPCAHGMCITRSLQVTGHSARSTCTGIQAMY